MNGLRFFTHSDTSAVRIELAGSLCGVDVEAAYEAWQREAWNDVLKPVTVDITLITDADEQGLALLVVMHRFGAEIIAKSPQSSAIAQPLLAHPVESVTSRPGWFRRLTGFLLEDRRRVGTFPPRAEMISLTSALDRIGSYEHRGTGHLMEA